LEALQVAKDTGSVVQEFLHLRSFSIPHTALVHQRSNVDLAALFGGGDILHPDFLAEDPQESLFRIANNERYRTITW
jgi:hypothetical protein